MSKSDGASLARKRQHSMQPPAEPQCLQHKEPRIWNAFARTRMLCTSKTSYEQLNAKYIVTLDPVPAELESLAGAPQPGQCKYLSVGFLFSARFGIIPACCLHRISLTISFTEMSYPKYQHEQPGLEAVRSDEAPEVVPETQLRAPLERQSSLSRPEAYFHPQVDYQAEKAHSPRHSYYVQSKSPQPRNEQAKFGQPPGYQGDADKQVVDERSERRTCGMRRKLFWWIIAGVVLLVVITAVLGGVLGSVLHKGSRSWVFQSYVCFTTLTSRQLCIVNSANESSAKRHRCTKARYAGEHWSDHGLTR